MAFLTFALLGATLAHGEVLTHDQALRKITEWGPDRTADKIVAFDRVLQTDPVVSVPLVAVVVGRDGILRVSLQGPVLIDVTEAVHYELTLGPWSVPDPTPDPGPWPAVLAGGGGLILGLLAGVLIGVLVR
jgi:hypothetical protein